MSQAIQELAKQGHSIRALCQGLAFPRSQFYRNITAPEPTKSDAALRENIQQIARENIQQIALDCSCYGYRRVTRALHRQGVQANYKRVLHLMREDNLLCVRKKWR